MKKYVLLAVLVLVAYVSRAQDRYLTHTGQIRSFSQEKKEAVNRNSPAPIAWCAMGSSYQPYSGHRWRLFMQVATPSVPEFRSAKIRQSGMESQRAPRKLALLATVQPAFVSPRSVPH